MRHCITSKPAQSAICSLHRQHLYPFHLSACNVSGNQLARIAIAASAAALASEGTMSSSSTAAAESGSAIMAEPSTVPATTSSTKDHGDDVAFTSPMAITQIDTEQYQGQLQAKLRRLHTLFEDLKPPGVEVEVYESPPSHYRMRAEFTVHQPQQGTGELHFVMFDSSISRKQPRRIIIDTFPVASRLVNELMPIVRAECAASPVLRERLFQVNFHSTLCGDSMVTMLYHRKLGPEWVEAAQGLRRKLLEGAPSACGHMPQIIGRSRKQKVELDCGYVVERLQVNGRVYVQKQVEGAFSQPNSTACQHMLSWAQRVTAGSSTPDEPSDLLELYCGNGNFTVPLAQNFRTVVATEVAKASVDAARYNMDANGIGNVFLARMASEEFAETMRARGTRRRLAGLAPWDELRLRTVLVDPPRAGLDAFTVQLLSEFDNIVYISCNPETLHANLKAIEGTHRIARFAAFDAFPYTHHLECGVYLQRR